VAGKRPFISLTTDCGAASTATCAGVVYALAPEANVLILSHEVTKYQVIEGAMLLRHALPYFPVGVHVAVVESGAGPAGQPVAVEAGRGDVLLGPDNGLLLPACERLGGIARAHRLEPPHPPRPEEAASRGGDARDTGPGGLRGGDVREAGAGGLRGGDARDAGAGGLRGRDLWGGAAVGFAARDVFAPAAARIALGVDLAELGPRLHTLTELDIPAPRLGDGEISVPVLYADEWGRLVLGAETRDVAGVFGDLPPGTAMEATWLDATGETRRLRLPYGTEPADVPAGSPVLYVDVSGQLAIAAGHGPAAAALGLARTDMITLRKAKASISG
jgi:S-adenosylmethionine hydrolase